MSELWKHYGNQINQSQRTVCCMNTFIQNTQNRQIYRNRMYISGSLGLGEWLDWGMMAKEYEISFWNNVNILNLIVVKVAQISEYTINHCSELYKNVENKSLKFNKLLIKNYIVETLKNLNYLKIFNFWDSKRNHVCMRATSMGQNCNFSKESPRS